MNVIQVLMSTYNGERFIKEQIDSILQQENVEVRLLIRDDGSSDATKDIIKSYLIDDRITFVEGKNLGYGKSFLWLLDHCPRADYYAYADQDDVWKQDKLSVAIDRINGVPEHDRIPVLYASALERVDERLNHQGYQNFPYLKLDCYSEIVRHRFAGCTYVFNNILRDNCSGASDIDQLRYPHDCWVGLMCWLTGGTIVYDSDSYILFRRYGTNSSVDGKGMIGRICYELEPFTRSRRLKSDVMNVIKQHYMDRVTPQYRDLVMALADYDASLKQWIHVLLMPGFDCGIFVANVIFKSTILLRCM